MIADSTSREAYDAAYAQGLIGKCQMKVVEYLLNHETATQREVQVHYNNNVSRTYGTRFKELERAGVIECGGTRLDPETKCKVKFYRLVKAPTLKVGSLKPAQKIELTDNLALAINEVDAIVKRADCVIHSKVSADLWKALVTVANARVIGLMKQIRKM